MTQVQWLSKFRELSIREQIEMLQAGLTVIRDALASMDDSQPPDTSRRLSDAAQLLLADYESDEELTCFTSLDGEPFHATR